MADSHPPVTQVLAEVQRGDAWARDRLVAMVYEEIRRVAERLMARERNDHTLQPTALVHEAMVRLLDGDAIDRAPDRRQLYATLAATMRHVLIDHARKRSARKRQAGDRKVALDDLLEHFEQRSFDVVAVHEALEALAARSERQSQVMSLRFFGGMSMREIADQLGVSLSTVESDFRIARAWLHLTLTEGEP